MKKWTWQWLALLGLVGMIFFGVDWVRAELVPPTPVVYEEPLVDEDAIEVYHEPLYYDHFLVKKVGVGVGHRA